MAGLYDVHDDLAKMKKVSKPFCQDALLGLYVNKQVRNKDNPDIFKMKVEAYAIFGSLRYEQRHA